MLCMHSCTAPLTEKRVAIADDVKVAIERLRGSRVKNAIGAVFARSGEEVQSSAYRNRGRRSGPALGRSRSSGSMARATSRNFTAQSLDGFIHSSTGSKAG